MRVTRKRLAPSFEDLANWFDLLFTDARELGDLEAESIDNILHGDRDKRILDCACGTGIPSIGLARLGYHLSASDVSPAMLRRLRAKARRTGLAIRTAVADFRELTPWEGQLFDAVICTGNSLPLLVTRREMRKAVRAMHRVLIPGRGRVIIGVRDYHLSRRIEGDIVLRRVAEDGTVLIDIRRFRRNWVEVYYVRLQRLGADYKKVSSTKRYAYLGPREAADLLVSEGFRNVLVTNMRGTGRYTGGLWGFAVGTC